MKSKRSGRKVRVSRTGTRFVIAALFCLGCMSCSTAQKISVKQSQGDQTQETTIEHTGKLDNLSLSIINPLNVWTL